MQLRLHNPFLATRALRPGDLIAYPPEPREDLFSIAEDGALQYRARLGDNYLQLAFTLGVDLDRLRDANNLWRLQSVLPGMILTIPPHTMAKFTEYRVGVRESLTRVVARLDVNPWWIIRDNHLWDEEIQPGMVLRVRQVPPKPAYRVHRVRRGENLDTIARWFETSIAAIQSANSLGRRTLIRIGQRLRIPAR